MGMSELAILLAVGLSGIALVLVIAVAVMFGLRSRPPK